MDKPISVGDLVQIVAECCDPGTVRGRFGMVLEISLGLFECEDCLHLERSVQTNIEGLAQLPDEPFEAFGWVPLAWLKRIPPLSELEGEKTQEDIREPA